MRSVQSEHLADAAEAGPVFAGALLGDVARCWWRPGLVWAVRVVAREESRSCEDSREHAEREGCEGWRKHDEAGREGERERAGVL